MKKSLLFFIFFCTAMQAQIVTIPDPLFKAQLLSHEPVIDTNTDGEIQVSEALAATEISITGTGITDFTGIAAFSNITFISCVGASVTSLDLSMLDNLNSISMPAGQLISLTLGSIPVTGIDVANNHLTSLDVSGLANLIVLDVSTNELASLTFGYQPTITNVTASANNLVTLDVSGLTSLSYLQLDGNDLIAVNMKNGSFESSAAYMSLFQNPTLQFVCADDSQIQELQVAADLLGNPAVINSYCSFIPGGDYNTINGVVTFDDEGDGCDASDVHDPLVRMNFSNGTSQWATYTNAAANYNFYALAGNYTVTPSMENPSYFTASPASASVSFPTNGNLVSTNNFCIAPNGVHPDLEIVAAPVVPARPGFDAVYQLTYRNKGNQVLSGAVNLLYQEPQLDFVSATVAPTLQASGSLSWNYAALVPFESRSITVTLNVNAPTDTPPVNVGDQLDFASDITPLAGDETPADNTFSYKQEVIGSFDPNDKTCLEGNSVSTTMIGEYLHYIINFENTGTAEAVNIVVKDTLDVSKFDISSLRLMSSSHPVNVQLNGNIAEFIFQNINLEIGGHGNILLKIRTKDDLAEGDEVVNKADIYFDYNHPVITNEARTVFEMLAVGEHGRDESVSVYPNPSHGVFNITAGTEIQSVQLYDVQGRLLQTKMPGRANISLDLTNRQTGIYFVKVISEKGFAVEKIIKN